MSPENYTFACPACGIHLSVPRVLAGVRGPCPQCQREITAPEPTDRVFRAPFADPPSTAPPATQPVAPTPSVETQAGPGVARRDVAVEQPEPPEEEEADVLSETPKVGKRGSSRWVAVCGSVVVLGLVVAAGLNFLPAGTLQSWKARLGKSTSSSSVPPRPVVDSVSAEKSEPAVGGDPLPARREPAAPPASVETAHSVEPLVPMPPTPPPGAADPDPSTTAELATADKGKAPTAVPTESPVPEPPPTQAAEALDPSLRPTDPPSLLPDLGRDAAAAPTDGASPARPAAPDAERAEPMKALEAFLRAPTWTERLAHCLTPEQVRPAMEEYYATSKDGPQSHTSALFVASSPLPGPKQYTIDVFHVTFPDLPQGFPIPVEQTDSGWKIDWRAFVEFRDSRLKKFFAKYQDPPAIFRVQLQRTHYYDKEVPNLEEKYCFRVAAPIHGHDGYVFVDKRDSIAVPKLDGKLEWDVVHHVMVKLKWVKGTGGHPYVELRDVAANSWRDGSSPRLGQK